MDIFCEYIVKKKTTAKERVKQMGIILLAMILSLILFILNNLIFGLGVLLIVGVIYGAIYLFKKTNIEYEYILTNSVLDIDIIYSKSSRKRVESIDFKNVEAFGQALNAPNTDAKELDYSGDITADDVYYVEYFKDKEKRRVYFQPNQKILENLSKVAPRLMYNLRGGAE